MLREFLGVLVLLPTLPAMGEEPPRFLYVEQEAEELKLKGDPETRRETAALLPLRRACAALREGREPIARPDGHYINGLLLTIEQKGWVSPLPLLATALEVDYRRGRVWPLLGPLDVAPAARTWLRLAVRDMTAAEKSALVLRILDGREPSVRTAMIRAVTTPLGGLVWRDIRGLDRTSLRDAVVALLAERDYVLENLSDCDRAKLFAEVLGSTELRTEDIKRIYHNQVPFNLLVLLSPGARLRISDGMDDMFVKCCRELWKLEGAPSEVQTALRFAITGNRNLIVGMKGADAFILELLKDMNKAPEGTAAKDVAMTELVAAAQTIVFEQHRPLSSELHVYLEQIAKDKRYDPRSEQYASMCSIIGFILPEQERLLVSAKEKPGIE